ncbi:DUF4191 domain-containing protein [Stomatohabitans albus]|uniref:DUF4191 domain-containing protein n=1 Tax=Stomatohabitans albus TaxID=3110766 RepID=UPI00300C1630
MERIKNLWTMFTLTHQNNPKVVWWMALAALGTLAVFIITGILTTHIWPWAITGVLMAGLVAMIILGRSATKVQMDAIRDQKGAAAAILQTMRGGWQVAPGVAFNRRQDMVHLCVGRPGVVLVGEGDSASRVRQLLNQEQRHYQRSAGSVPVQTVVVGTGPNTVKLDDLSLHLTKMDRTIKTGEIGPLFRKLTALGSSKPPMPKGPLGGSGRVPRKMR